VQITGHEAQTQSLFDRVLRMTRTEPQRTAARRPSVASPARPQKPASDRSPTTIAVLPFRTGTGDLLESEIAGALADELITVLSKLSGLSVIARDSVFALREPETDRHALMATLGASHVLSGVVRRAGERLRVTAQLDEASSGECIWADRFESGRVDVFSILDEICDRIVTALEVRLTFGEQVRLWRRRMTNLDAYTCYLKAIEHYNRFHKEENAIVRAELDKAIELDPAFAAAYAYLGWVYATDAHFGWRADREGLLQHSLVLADKALDLDSTLADACAVRAFAGSPEEAVDLERQALRLSPITQENYLLELGRARAATAVSGRGPAGAAHQPEVFHGAVGGAAPVSRSRRPRAVQVRIVGCGAASLKPAQGTWDRPRPVAGSRPTTIHDSGGYCAQIQLPGDVLKHDHGAGHQAVTAVNGCDRILHQHRQPDSVPQQTIGRRHHRAVRIHGAAHHTRRSPARQSTRQCEHGVNRSTLGFRDEPAGDPLRTAVAVEHAALEIYRKHCRSSETGTRQ
jgi:TolB-like protein